MRPAAVTALLGAVLTLCAAAFDAEPLYVPGVAFLALAGGAAAWVVLGARGLRVERTVGARSVIEDEVVAIEVRVHAGLVVLPSGAVSDPLLSELAPLSAGRRTTTVRINARFSRRGRRVLQPPRVLVADPFGLAMREVAAATSDEVLVLPKILPVLAAGGAGDGDTLGLRRGRPWVAAEIDLDGVRPYRTGAPASRIVWPAFARSDELLERRLRADTDTRPLIVLDPRGPQQPEDLDNAVRAATSLAVHLARLGGCALLLPGDRRPAGLEPTLAGWERLHVRLALVEAHMPPSLAQLGSRRGPVLYVSARRGAKAPRALAAAPGGGRLLIVPGTLAGRSPAFSVAGCSGYELTDATRRLEATAAS
jgi:uncharacterized protein (DUF58 family)